MKTLITILSGLLVAASSFAQITTTKIAPAAVKIDKTPYDSLTNFLEDKPYGYIGQDLYLLGMSESLRSYGYDNFSIDYTKSTLLNRDNVYKCCDGYHSKYADLNGKYFTVVDVIRHPDAEKSEILYGHKYYLKLIEKSSKDTVYFEYDGNSKYSFPFVTVGYFVKLKQLMVGEKYIVRGKNWISSTSPMTDISTGNTVTEFEPGKEWKCVDVTIDEKYFSLSLVLQNSKGQQIPLDVDNASRTYWIFESKRAAYYSKKFGPENWDKILNGKIKVGMTKEMCTLSWGEPKKVNKTVTSGKVSEQWVYDSNYIYFDNGVVTAMQ